jgi:hypothetical protein
MPDLVSLIRLPDSQVAPGYRESLAIRSQFTVDELGGGIVAVAPAEGPGSTASHFSLTKICDADSDLADAATWGPLRSRPPRKRRDVDAGAYREQMLQRGAEITKENPGVPSEIVAFALAAMGAGEAGDLEDLLAVNLPLLFAQFPRGSLWQVAVSDVLLARLAFGRTQIALQLTPDITVSPEMEQLRAFADLGISSGIDFSAVMTVPLLALSPAVLGFLIPAMPHVLVFCFGADVDLRRPYPISLASLYRPRVLQDPEGLDRSTFASTLDPDDGPNLLAWWVEQLNRFYSHITDPTRFTDAEGYYDGAGQTAWMITFERLLGDALSLLAEPQASDLHRVQIAFDLLDKAEALLGYDRAASGRGFEALLRRRPTMRRVRDAYTSLPGNLGDRLGDEAQRLFDGLYSEVRGNTLGFRLRERGANIAYGDARTLRAIDDETLVATMCRAVRNSSHGLLDVLRAHDDRFLLAANTDGIPAELSALVPLVGLAMVADPDGLLEGTWRAKLVAQR